MPQSLAKVYLHLVFSTKNRQPMLNEDIRGDLHKYLGGILRDISCQAIEINSEPDHVHILYLQSRTEAIGDVVANVKRGSSVWLKTKGVGDFHWQAGYGIFSVSQSAVEDVRVYIRNQREHHRRMSFQDELRALLRRHEIEFDEKYLWD
jgi:putative transposase